MFKHWYITHILECPVCGKVDQYKERVYEKPEITIIYEQNYDWCDIL